MFFRNDRSFSRITDQSYLSVLFSLKRNENMCARYVLMPSGETVLVPSEKVVVSSKRRYHLE